MQNIIYIKCIFQERQELRNNAAWIRAPQSRRGPLRKKKKTTWAQRRRKKEGWGKVGQVYMLQLYSWVMGIPCSGAQHILWGVNN